MQAEKRKNKHDDDDQADEVNYSIHDRPPTGGRSGRSGRPPNKLFADITVPIVRKFLFEIAIHEISVVGQATEPLQSDPTG